MLVLLNILVSHLQPHQKSLYSKLLFSYGYGRSLQMSPFDRLYTSFYCSSIVNIALCCTIFELLTLNNRDLEILVMGH